MRKRSPFKETILHMMTAILLFAKGIDKAGQGHYLTGILILSAALFITVYLFISLRVEKPRLKLTLSVYICEAMALVLAGFVYLEEGKKYIPWVTFLAAAGFIISAIILARKGMRKKNVI
jgi:hypothetical protein